MNHTAPSCNDDRLRVLLGGSEDSADFRSAAEHLECCSDCQSRLSELAANRDEWDRAKHSLVTDPADELIQREQIDRSWTVVCPTRLPQTWTESMTRQLLSPPSHPEMLGRLGRYEVERLIGAGGMGIVFKGFDSELNRPVAIKVLAPHLAGSGAARKRFEREARAAAAIVHERVVAIHNVESDSEPPFLVMQYVAGESLQQRLDRDGPLNIREILRIAHQTAAGLAAAHKQGLVHRDVKPSNILLEQGVDRALLTDFGLARASDDASLTHSGHVPGTPHYMSPEQARGDAADQSSDLFSLGSVIYAMCTGRSPFRAETSYGVLRRITDDSPTPVGSVNSEIPGWLSTIVTRLMAKDPAQRYSSADQAASLLEECLAHVQQPATVSLPVELASKPAGFLSGLSKRAIGLIGTVGLVLLGLLLWQATSPPDIAGPWIGDEWGRIELTKSNPYEYSGTYANTFDRARGRVKLTWSRVERRFNGTWREADNRFGRISVRLVGSEIRGAWTTSADAKINPGTPGLSDLLWTRASATWYGRAASAAVGARTDDDGPTVSQADGASRLTNWDSAATEVQQLDKVFDAFQSSADRLWDNNPSPSHDAEANAGDDDNGRESTGGTTQSKGVFRANRWSVRYADIGTLESYISQLDFFNTELAVITPDGRLTYLSNLSTSPTLRSVSHGRDEIRLYLVCSDTDHRQADVELFSKVGVDASECTILHFYDRDTEALLFELERSHTEQSGRSIEDIKQTEFQIRQVGTEFEFLVAKQIYFGS